MNQSSNHLNLYFMFCIELINDGVPLTGKITKSFKNGWLGKTLEKMQYLHPGCIFVFKINNGNTKPKREICF